MGLTPLGVEVVARAVVDDEEDLPPGAAHEPRQELEEGPGVEDLGELRVEARPALQRQRAKDVRGLAHAEGVDARLHADAGPRLVQRPIEPEAGLVLVQDYAAAGGRFCLMRGSFSRSHRASASARANRRRGHCTEKPSSCNSRGTWWLWYRTPKRCAIRSPIMGPVQTPQVYPASFGPDSISAVSSSRWATLSFGEGPGGLPVTSPSTPSASYHCSHRLTDTHA